MRRVAEPSADGRYVRVTFDVWYDPGTKRVHLTSNDPDLPKDGIHTDFRPGTQADRNSRALLAKFGKLPSGA